MAFINEFFANLAGLGKYLMVPLMIAIIGVLFKVNVDKAIKGGITVGIGLFGLDLALSIVSDYLGPVANGLVTKANLNLDVVDVGWQALSGIAFGTQIGAMIIPVMILFNVIMVTIGASRTMNVDIWNFWHYAVTGSLVYFVTNNILYSLLAAIAHAAIILLFADRTASRVQEVTGIPGISIPHGGVLGQWIVGFIMEPIYNFIGKRFRNDKKTKIDNGQGKKLQENAIFKIIQDPIYLGFILGTVLGFIAGQGAKTSFTTGMAMAAFLYLTPRMVKILMEGLLPINQAVQKMRSKMDGNSDLYIGMDNAVGLGHNTVMLITVIAIPILIVLAAIVPGNRVIPIASLAACGYCSSMLNVVHKGKFGRTLFSTTILFISTLLIASYMAPVITEVAILSGFETEYALISSLSGGTLIAAAPFFLAFRFSNTAGLIFSLIIIVGTIVLQRIYFKNKDQQEETKEVKQV